MTHLTLIAHITAKADKTEFMRAALEKLIAPTRAEAGCVTYDLHQDNENPAHFMLYEVWETRALWQDHMNTPHLKAFMAGAEDAIEKLQLHEMTQIG